MNGLTNTDLAHLARLQIAQRKEEAKARRLGRAVRAARRTSHPRRPVVTR
ncbi:MAG: hypothetical protein ACRDPQ_02270 [Nocardioidaceae bacterium]